MWLLLSLNHTLLPSYPSFQPPFVLSVNQLSGQEKILDLGCGWGAMLKFLRDSGYQGELFGLTLAKEQLVYAKQELNLDVKLKNFVTDSFDDRNYDRIFSIGALEHVRPQELSALYHKIYDALTPGGLAVHQFFSFNKEPYPVSAIALQIFSPARCLSYITNILKQLTAQVSKLPTTPSTIINRQLVLGTND